MHSSWQILGKRLYIVVLIVLFAAQQASAAQKDCDKRVQLAVDIRDGSHVLGMSSTDTMQFHCAFGEVAVPLAKVRSLAMHDDRERAKLTFRNGDFLTGVPEWSPVTIEAVFGTVSVKIVDVLKIEVIIPEGAVEEGLILWNTLGSKREVENSRVGRGGIYRGCQFEEGVHGAALVAMHDENARVAFPAEIVPAEAGCIEIWARFVGFPQELAWGANPWLFKLQSPQGQFSIHLNGNDGAARGGLAAAPRQA